MAAQLVDTHCHIHEASEAFVGNSETHSRWQKNPLLTSDTMIKSAALDGVTRLICVGTTVQDSELAVAFVQQRPDTWASIGVHPHEAKAHASGKIVETFNKLAKQPKVVAVGECGLDYYYDHSPKQDQIRILRLQIECALEHGLPLIFHVRDAFEDFWPIFDDYSGIRGVIHSFSATEVELEQVLARNLYVGLNGIMTFTKDDKQLAAAKAVPLDRLVLETDAPFLTPVPFRGKICEPRYVRATAEFLAELRKENNDELARVTTDNARALFGLF
jgi:TatD DNase family protein